MYLRWEVSSCAHDEYYAKLDIDIYIFSMVSNDRCLELRKQRYTKYEEPKHRHLTNPTALGNVKKVMYIQGLQEELGASAKFVNETPGDKRKRMAFHENGKKYLRKVAKYQRDNGGKLPDTTKPEWKVPIPPENYMSTKKYVTSEEVEEELRQRKRSKELEERTRDLVMKCFKAKTPEEGEKYCKELDDLRKMVEIKWQVLNSRQSHYM